MPNPYHDSLGRFTSRQGQLANIQRAIANNDVAGYLAEMKALKEADAAANYIAIKPTKGMHPALALKEEDIAERDRVLTEGSREDIEYYLEERANRPEFIALLSERDAVRERAKKLNDEYKLLQVAADQYENFDYEVVRQKGFEALEAYEELQVLKNQANEYKDITAPTAARLSAIIQEEEEANGTYREYDADTLNSLVKTGEFPSGSREWLEQRQNGIGGSDVGNIIGVYEQYAQRDYERMLESKLEPISEEEVEEQAGNHADYSGYTGRGNAWEELIVHKFSENNPDLNITHCKTSWKNKDVPYQFANFDGLMTDENGNPNGILEIKTASDASKWGDPKDGLNAVPPNYKAQALWYAQAAGFEKGAVAVMIDDREYREYHFTMTPELKAEAASNLEKVDSFVKEVEARKNGTWVEPEKIVRSNKGFGRGMLNASAGGDDSAFKEAAIYREESIDQTRDRFNQICKDSSDPEEVKRALTTLYTEKDPATLKSKIIAVDIETSASTPTKGRIIEVGISVRDPQGGEVEKYSKLYGLPKKALEGNGTGAVEVHGITAGKIAKKRQFTHPEVQEEVLTKLKEGILVAHNANFELRWFRQHLKGFAEAERRGEIRILDTMTLSRRLLPDTPNNTLGSFAAKFGINYVNAHRAYNDAEMMARALEGFRNFIFKGKSNDKLAA